MSTMDDTATSSVPIGTEESPVELIRPIGRMRQIDSLRAAYGWWALGLFSGQLLIVLALVIVFACIDSRRLALAFDLAEEGDADASIVAAVPLAINPSVLTAMIAGTVAQAGAAFFLITRSLFKDV